MSNPNVAQNPDMQFEKRCERRFAAYIKANKGRVWRCTECGERYGATYRYHYRECAECGGDLEEADDDAASEQK